MHLIGFFFFLLVIGFLIEGARRNGEIKFTTTKSEQSRIDSRGRLLMGLCWIPVGALLCNLLSWLAGGIQESDKLVVYGFVMVAAGIPAGLIAALVNSYLERTNHRIQKSVFRKR